MERAGRVPLAELRGGALRPGDVVLIDLRGGYRPHHITMVESYDAATRMLVTIEGNTHGIQSDGAGGLVVDPRSTGTGIGLLPRDLGTITPEVTTSLGSTGQQPGGGLVPVQSGATVFGVGRPSIVDFEDRPRLTNVPEGERATRPPE